MTLDVKLIQQYLDQAMEILDGPIELQVKGYVPSWRVIAALNKLHHVKRILEYPELSTK